MPDMEPNRDRGIEIEEGNRIRIPIPDPRSHGLRMTPMCARRFMARPRRAVGCQRTFFSVSHRPQPGAAIRGSR